MFLLAVPPLLEQVASLTYAICLYDFLMSTF